ncbi:histidine--tRNA ligase [Ponticaulis sp.]|uniref:histidine--tRNA ligase n=1 Tax=Ponticaulis sp. TaxID=2020902 RepID=UPI00345C1640
MMAKNKKPNPKSLARKPRGFPDKREDVLKAELDMIHRVSSVYRLWGFEGIETGAFEYADALGKFLPDQDRPNAGVFAIQDDDEQWMSLRYDLTAPLARFAAENWDTLPKPFRRYAYGPVWRNEKPGPGRFREFMQCDADTVGAKGPAADAEMIAMMAEALKAAGAQRFNVRVNTRDLMSGLLDSIDARDEETRLTILRALDKLDRLGLSGVADLLGEGREDESGDYTKGAGLDAERVKRVLAFAESGKSSRGETLEALAAVVSGNEAYDRGIAELREIDGLLSAMGTPDGVVVFDPTIVRGLEYYTGPVFEGELLDEILDEKGRAVRIGSVGGGGRYDGLVSRFRNEEIPATGFSLGISRLAAAMSLTGELDALSGPVVVLVLDREHVADSHVLAHQLRAAGIRSEVYMGSSGMRPQMKYADRRGAPAVVIVGEDERQKGTVTIKDLIVGAQKAKAIKDNTEWRESRPGQVEVSRDEMVATIKGMLEADN